MEGKKTDLRNIYSSPGHLIKANMYLQTLSMVDRKMIFPRWIDIDIQKMYSENVCWILAKYHSREVTSRNSSRNADRKDHFDAGPLVVLGTVPESNLKDDCFL